MDVAAPVPLAGQGVAGEAAAEGLAGARLLEELDGVGIGAADLDDRADDLVGGGRGIDDPVGLAGVRSASQGGSVPSPAREADWPCRFRTRKILREFKR